MADTGLLLADVLDPFLYERSRSVRASYAEHVSDLGIPSYEGLVAGHTITLYHCLPWLFSDAVTGLSEAQHHDLAVAGLLYFSHALLVDRMIDGDDDFSPQMLLSSDSLHERSLVILAGAHMLGASSAEALLRYTRAYERAIACERGAAQNALFGWTDYHAVATGKAALLKAAPALMTVAAGREELRAATDEMVDLFNVAAQVHDDVKDWRKDVPAGRPGLILALAQLANIERSDIDALLQRPEEHIAHWLFMEGHAERALAEGTQAAARASALASSIGANRWSKATKYYADRLERLRGQLSRTRHRVATKAATPLRTRDRQMTRSAVSWLLSQIDPGVDDHAHRMTFSPQFGFSAESPQQVGAVFCRAVSGWALDVARAHGISVPTRALRGNLAELRALRRRDEAGGWSYFPGLPELPPDADDVGQVALACGTTAPSPMIAALADARELILEQHVRADGAIGTWLTDARSSPDLVARYDHAIRTKWGRAFDPEVTSNLVFGLKQAGLGLPEAVVSRAAAWVAESQYLVRRPVLRDICMHAIPCIGGGIPGVPSPRTDVPAEFPACRWRMGWRQQ